MPSAQEAPAGLYYSQAFPFLGCLASICCGIRSERELFSRSGDGFWTYCRQRYGLSAEQTNILVAANSNPTAQGHDCLPTGEQIEAIVKVLEKELEGAVVPAVATPAKEALEPALLKLYPTLGELYRSFVLGEGPRPEEIWHAKLRVEFDRAPNVW